MIYRMETKKAMIRLEKEVIGKLVEAGITVELYEGWKTEWVKYFADQDEYPWKSPIQFHCLYGSHPLRLNVVRQECDIADFGVTVFSEHEAWKTVWHMMVFADGVFKDDGFNFAALIGIGPEEIPF